MFRKFTKQGFFDAVQKTKTHLGNAYHHTKTFLGHVDNGIRTAKKVYSILEPHISHFAGQNNKAHQGIMKAVHGYDEIKHKVINHHDAIENRVKDIAHKFKRGGLSLGIE